MKVAVQKDIREFIDLAETKPGWRVEYTARSAVFLGPMGQRVTVPTTHVKPGRTLMNIKANLRRAGLFDSAVPVDRLHHDNVEAAGLPEAVAAAATRRVAQGEDVSISQVALGALQVLACEPLIEAAQERAAEKRATIDQPPPPEEAIVSRPPSPVRQQIADTIADIDGEVTIAEIYDMFPDAPKSTIRNGMRALTEKGAVVHVDSGVYVKGGAHVDIRRRSSGISRKVIQALRDADGILTAEEIAVKTGLTRDQVIGAAGYLRSLGEVRKIVNGAYELAERAEHVVHNGTVEHHHDTATAPVSAPVVSPAPASPAPSSTGFTRRDALAMLALAIPGLSIPIELYDAVDEWVTTTSTLVARLTEAPT